MGIGVRVSREAFEIRPLDIPTWGSAGDLMCQSNMLAMILLSGCATAGRKARHEPFQIPVGDIPGKHQHGTVLGQVVWGICSIFRYLDPYGKKGALCVREQRVE